MDYRSLGVSGGDALMHIGIGLVLCSVVASSELVVRENILCCYVFALKLSAEKLSFEPATGRSHERCGYHQVDPRYLP
jgi:hypothetical protein